MSNDATPSKPRVKALLSIQFYNDPHGTLSMLVTGDTTGTEASIADNFSMMVFGKGLAGVEVIDENEKKALERLCKAYLTTREESKQPN